jgi:DNA topoisomerase I
MSIQEYTSEARNRPTAAPDGPRQSAATLKLLKRLRLTYITTADLTLQRQRHGRGFRYLTPDGKPVGAAEAKRLASLAVPPAYVDVLYAADPRAHIQAIGRDAAGRLQYRYHPDWQRVRETRKARRLARLAEALPQIRRSIGQHLSGAAPTRAFTLAAIIELVARTAIRPGTEQYAKLRGTLGAATLLKSNVSIYGETVKLRFKAKGGKLIEKEVRAPKLAGAIRPANAQEVNGFLRDISGVQITLKDFRTLLASVSVLDALAQAEPAGSQRARRRQVLDAICHAAAELGNTPAICRKSYVHETVVNAFEDGALERFAEMLRASRSSAQREKVLARVAAKIETSVAA